MSAVMTVTLILIGSFVTSVIVFTCVLFTVINIAGMMYFQGLTVEIVTSICLILSIGLAVDYSAHMGHMYATLKGKRKGKVCLAISGTPLDKLRKKSVNIA